MTINPFINSYCITCDDSRYKLLSKIFNYNNIPIPIKCIGIVNSNGVIGCALSHLSLVKYAKANDLDYIVIYEDDAYPCFNIKFLLDYYCKDIPDDADCLVLGTISAFPYGSHLKYKYSPNIYGSHAYILFKSSYDRYIHFMTNEYKLGTLPADIILKNFRTYICADNLFIQYNKTSYKTINMHLDKTVVDDDEYIGLIYTIDGKKNVFDVFPPINTYFTNIKR